MKLKFLGTGSISNKDNSASYLIDDKILIDMPGGNYKNMLRMDINFQNINDILFTHFHGDHFLDIPFFLLEKLKLNDKHIVNLYTFKKGNEIIKTINKIAFINDYHKFKISYNNLDEFNINEYKIKRITVKHGTMKACGYILSNDNLTVGFTGDASLNANIEYMASICNYLICDCSLKIGNNKHMGIDNILYLSNKYPNCHIITSHMFWETKIDLNKIKNKKIIIPDDGLEMELN